MALYIVCYDLDEPGQKYECIKEVLEAYGTYWRFQKSNWIVRTDENSVSIKAKLLPCLDQGDKLFVARLEGEGAWHGYSDQGNQWFLNRLTKDAR